ncbi:MAG: TldD/PmbA family protein [Candidatus Diapherotrites archaeon]|nr:TldD/PmbA family protein [Candidatus Diapherotrites archaeon]
MKKHVEPVQTSLDRVRSVQDVLVKAVRVPGKNTYIDLRFDASQGMGVGTQNGNPLGAGVDYDFALGVRAFVRMANVTGMGFVGQSISLRDLDRLKPLAVKIKSLSIRRAKLNAVQKAKLKKNRANASTVQSIAYDEMPAHKDLVEATAKKPFRELEVQDFLRRVNSLARAMKKQQNIQSALIQAYAGEGAKFFCNSNGSEILQVRPLAESFVYATAQGKGPVDYYATLGAYKGLEAFEGENEFGVSLEAFGMDLAKGTSELSNAPVAPTTSKPVTVVTNPHFNSLMVHEICGHPSEADRALKRETAWAGRAWWYHSPQENWFGKPVASPLVSVFSDPSLDGYGRYAYDDEGTKARKVEHIREGVLTDFLNSVDTSFILGAKPNGGMRASSAAVVPLIRMNNTCFAPGEWNEEELLRDTREGFYIAGQKIPSIGDTRQNFRITCWKVYEIKNGELGQLYRMGGITSDSLDYLKSIDAVGKDFKLYNIPNCGKGTPMQTMKVGNGAPTMRGLARVTGGEASL